jgi:hypothetical protein
MATRSNICYYESGSDDFICAYLHFDGYLDGVGAVIAEKFRDESSARELAYLGEISTVLPSPLHPIKNWVKIADVNVTVYAEREAPKRVAAADLAQYISSNPMIEYFYLFIGSKWVCVAPDSIWVLNEEWERVLNTKKPKKIVFTMVGENRDNLSVELIQ